MKTLLTPILLPQATSRRLRRPHDLFCLLPPLLVPDFASIAHVHLIDNGVPGPQTPLKFRFIELSCGILQQL